jgi:hypothetical protein
MTEEEMRLINQRDLEILNAHADCFKAEAEDVLLYRAEIDFEKELDEALLNGPTVVRISGADLEK